MFSPTLLLNRALTLTLALRPLSLGVRSMTLSYGYWRINKFHSKLVKHGMLKFDLTFQGT